MKRIFLSNSMLLLFFVSVMVLVVVSVIASRMMLASAQMLEESTQQEMGAFSQTVALMATADELAEYKTPADMQKPDYARLKSKLREFSERNDIPYAYFMRFDPESGMMRYIVDNVLENEDDRDGLDSEPEAIENGQRIALTGKVYTAAPGNYIEGWDGLISSWAPVYYNDGRLSNILACVDKYDIYIKQARNNMRLLSILLSASIIIVLLSCLGSLWLYRRKARQAQSASMAKSNFLSRMSHEMRTPMNAIIGLSNMAAETHDPAKIKEYLGNIRISSQHLRQLVDDVLDIAKIESGKMAHVSAPVNLRQEIEKIDRIIRPQTEAKQQALDIYIDPGIPENVLVDATYIRQILINLLSNAVKFTPKGGAVGLSVTVLTTKNNCYELEWRVKDNGIGISDAAKQKLFTPFEQGDNSNTRVYGGTGLGLAISKELVNLMGGDLKVDSAVDRGSEFSFSLCLNSAEPATPDADAANPPKTPSLQGLHVLLVEDTEINRMIFEDMFSSNYNAQVDTADNGAEGVAAYLAAPDKYDLIFMDIQMPVMDGYEATRQIRASDTPRAKTIPIIAITANVFKEDIERAFEAKMNGHVRKPFDIGQIEETMLTVLQAGT